MKKKNPNRFHLHVPPLLLKKKFLLNFFSLTAFAGLPRRGRRDRAGTWGPNTTNTQTSRVTKKIKKKEKEKSERKRWLDDSGRWLVKSNRKAEPRWPIGSARRHLFI